MDKYNMDLFLANLASSIDKPQVIKDYEDDMKSIIELVIEYPYVKREVIEKIDLDLIDDVIELFGDFDVDGVPSMPNHPIIEMILSQACKNNLLNLKPTKTTLSVNLF